MIDDDTESAVITTYGTEAQKALVESALEQLRRWQIVFQQAVEL